MEHTVNTKLKSEHKFVTDYCTVTLTDINGELSKAYCKPLNGQSFTLELSNPEVQLVFMAILEWQKITGGEYKLL